MTRNSKVGVVLVLLCVASMWFYVNRVLIPHQRADAAAHDAPRGNLSDLYPRWLGARELLLHHRNPYSPEITRQIQLGYYGRELDPNRPGDPTDQQAFAYPVYVAFLLAPSVGSSFEVVRVGFEWLLFAATVASVWLWLQSIGWEPSLLTRGLVALLALGSFPVVQGIKLQQLTLIAAFLIALSMTLLTKDRLFLAGIVLAIATIKPQLVLPLVLCLLFWITGDWIRRRSFLWGFAITMAVLVGASQVVLPGWLSYFASALRAYRRYAGGRSLLDQLLSPRVGQVFSVAALVIVLLACWRFRKETAQSKPFQYTIASALAVTLIVIPMFAPYNQVLLLPAILQIVREARELWNKSRISRVACALTVAVITWAWVVTLGLLFASIWLSPERLERGWAIPLYSSLAIPLVLLVQLYALMQGAWQRTIPAAAARLSET